MSSDDVEAGPSLAIEARGLTKRYLVYDRPHHRLWSTVFGRFAPRGESFTAVDGVDLDVSRGETVGVIGRNGSGKSTLLRMICGILPPTSGSVAVHGHVAPILSLGVGFTPEFTGRENVRMSAALLGIPDDAVEQTIEDTIRFAEIGEFFDRPVRSYSSGMSSRLAFALAIHANPEILIVDEVLAVGDEAFARKCFARIEALKAEGSTILFVSHASNTVVELCDRAILMEAGRRVLTSDPRTVVALYHRLLYAVPDDRVAVLEEIRAIDAGERSLEELAAPAESEPVAIPRKRARFDPGLVSQSTVEYASRGARIRNARVVDADGDRANVLDPTESYFYEYEVEFDESAFGVRFGMMVKAVTGLEIGGQASHAWGKGIEVVDAGRRARVRFAFQPRLTPGVYFLNAGVLGLSEQGESYLHRILDVLAFRVEGDEATLATGQVDLRAGTPAEVTLDASRASTGSAG